MLLWKELNYEVITPLYLGGTEPRKGLNESNEQRVRLDTRIRIRPILAMWRYWYRALAGGLLGTTAAALRLIHRREQELFGGVHEQNDDEAHAAKFRVRLVSQRIAEHREYTAHRDPLFNYLGFGVASTKEEGPRLGIAPKTTFTVEVVCDEATWDMLSTLNYIWVNCGGLGARHRRGLGSIAWHDPAYNPPARPYELLTAYRARFSMLFGTEANAAEFDERAGPEMPVIHSDWCQIKVSRPFGTWLEALSAIRNQLRIDVEKTSPPPTLHLGERGYGYRQGNGQSHEWVEVRTKKGFPYYPGRDKAEAQRALDGDRHPAPVLDNVSFGLPVAYSGWGMIVNVMLDGVELRRPSPVSFRVLQDGRGYRVAILYFKSRFLPK